MLNLNLLLFKTQNKKLYWAYKEVVIIVVEKIIFFFIVAPGIWELENILLPKKTEGKLELIYSYNDNHVTSRIRALQKSSKVWFKTIPGWEGRKPITREW